MQKELRKKSVDKRGRSNHPRTEAQAQQNLGNRLPSRRVRHPYDSRPSGNLAGVVFRQSMVRLRLRAQRRRRCVYDVLLQLDKRQRKRCSRYNTPHSFVRIFLDIGHILHFFAQQCKARISTARRCIDLHVGLVYRTKPNGNKRRIRCVRRA